MPKQKLTRSKSRLYFWSNNSGRHALHRTSTGRSLLSHRDLQAGMKQTYAGLRLVLIVILPRHRFRAAY